MQPSRFARLTATLSVFRWVGVVAAIVCALPLLSYGQSTLEGIFAELDAVSVALSVMGVITVSWSLVFVAGMLVEGALTRVVRDGHEHRRTTREGGPLLPSIERHFGVPTRPRQTLLVYALSLPACVVLGSRSTDGLWGWLAVPLGALVAWALVELFSAPVRAVLGKRWRSEGGAIPAVGRSADGVTRWARGWFRFCRAVFTFLFDSKLSRALGFDDVLETDETGERRLAGNHFMAFAATFGAFVVLSFFVLFSAPPDPLLGFQLPTAALIYVLITLLVWIGGALDYHAARYGLPLSLALIALVVGLAIFSRYADHDYDGEVVAANSGDETPPTLSAIEVASCSKGENLVVVCAAGGGILASGWTALALTELVAARPELLNEIRLISAVSGGAVGSAYFLSGLLEHAESLDPGSESWSVEWRELSRAIRAAAVDSSLEAVTYGLVFHDIPRLVTAGLAGGWIRRDRADLLEAQWQHAARERLQVGAVPARLSELADAARDGRIPAPIFNATAMEVGRRVMITPIRFESVESDARSARRRAPTLSEYLLGESSTSFVDLTLWTAARLSATFPYVTPAAHWKGAAERIRVQAARNGSITDHRAEHHMIDGGYYDNYGVASALDWLQEVLTHRQSCAACEHLPRSSRIAIVQLSAFPPARPESVPPSSNFIAALLGPAIGIASIRDGTATSRNEIELANFIDAWNERLGGQVEIRSFQIQPVEGDDPGPLSWRLTASQIAAMNARWQDPGVERALAELVQFLEN